MPQKIVLAEGLESTRLGFGCAGLFREPSRRKRLRLLESARDAGIRHFDVAPMYGLGVAEREVGRFIRGRRSGIVVATKFGIVPTRYARQLARIQAPIRMLFNAIPAFHRQVRSSIAGPQSGVAGAMLYAGGSYDGESARTSLEMSLREFKTDYIDLFLFHDPAPEDVRSEDVYAYLEHARCAGQIRAWGIAGEPAPTLSVARGLPGPTPVLQVRDEIFLRSRQPSLPEGVKVTFGVLGRPLYQLSEYVSADPERQRRWNAAIGINCRDLEMLAILLLRDALDVNRLGTVLFSSTRPERIRSAAAEVDEDRRDSSLENFRRLVQEELPSTNLWGRHR